ncbi:hypothetical protein SuNHUV7_22360 (plasmid) [Pseudoseohaeicola sp. NH-UV-7]|uniref:hypothetical protein n=1 Tax=Sulfitobacter sp. TBRI5 TaxID=2989732 RepID=UPI003A742444
MPNPITSEKSQLTAIQTKPDQGRSKPLPPLPKSLRKEYAAEWKSMIQHLRNIDAWVPQKAGIVETYFLNLMAVRDAQAAMTASGGIVMPDGRIHPSSAIIARHSATVNKLGEQLGLGKGKLIPNAPPKSNPASKVWSA